MHFVKVGDTFLNLDFVQKVTTNADGSLHAAHGAGATDIPAANAEAFVAALEAKDTAPKEHKTHAHGHKKAE